MLLSDFSKIRLLPEEEAALRRYAALDQIPEDALYLETFQRHGLLSRVDMKIDNMGSPYGGRLIVSDHGRRFLNSLDEKKRAKMKDDVRYWITTGISVLALIIALMAYLKQ